MGLFKEVMSLQLTLPRIMAIFAVISTVFSAIIPMAIPTLLGRVVDLMLNRATSDQLYLLIIIMFILTLSSAVATLMSSRLCVFIGHNLVQQLSRKTFESLVKMPYLTYSTIKQGVLISRLTNDIRMIEPLFVEVPATAIRGWSALFAASFALALVNAWFLLAFAVIPIKLTIIRFAEARINETIRNSFEYSAKISSIVNESTSSDAIGLIRQSGATSAEIQSFDIATRASATVASELDFWRASVRIVYDFSFGLILILILSIGVVSISYSLSSIGDTVSAILFLNLVKQPMNDLISLRYPMLRASIGLDRVQNVLRAKNTNLASIIAIRPRANEDHHASNIEDGKPIIEFKNVYFKYPKLSEIEVPGLSHIEAANGSLGFAGGTSYTKLVVGDTRPRESEDNRQWALADISFSAKKGEMIAIAGSSGAGKSTLISLICGMSRPSSGVILVNGLSTENQNEEDIWAQIALVSQSTYLRDASLRNNLSYGLKGISDGDLIESCSFAGLGDTLKKLPDGLETHVGIRGERLSGGERQRVSIARALLKRSSILVLDEATSHLDAAIEADVLQTIDRLRKHMAVIVIAHRPAVLERSDNIIMIEGGRIVERGTHFHLMALNGNYSSTHIVGRDNATPGESSV